MKKTGGCAISALSSGPPTQAKITAHPPSRCWPHTHLNTHMTTRTTSQSTGTWRASRCLAEPIVRDTSYSKGHAASPCPHAQEPSHGAHTSLSTYSRGRKMRCVHKAVPYARACVWECLNETTTAHGGCTPHCMSMWASCHRHTRSTWPCSSYKGALVVWGVYSTCVQDKYTR